MWDSKLNHSSLELLQRNRRRLTACQKEMLDVVRRRQEHSEYMQRQHREKEEAFGEDEHKHVDWTYAARCGIILMSSSSRSKPFIYCGHGNHVNRRGFCHIYRYCPGCNWIFKAKPAIDEFASDKPFYKAEWVFITISFTSNPAHSGCFHDDDVCRHFDPMDPHCVYDILGKYDPCPIPINDNPGASEEMFIACWNAGHTAIKVLKKEKRIAGYLGNEDLAIRFNARLREVFCECAGLPHDHYIVTTRPGDRLNLGVMEDIHRTATDFLREACPDLQLYVTVKGFGINDPETLSRVIRYTVKPIDFVEPYGIVLKCDEAKNPDGTLNGGFMVALNIGVDYLFDALEDGLFYGRRGVRRGGNLLCDRRTAYIGTKTLPRPRKKRSSGRLRRLEIAERQMRENPDFQIDTPTKPPSTAPGRPVGESSKVGRHEATISKFKGRFQVQNRMEKK